MTRIQQKCGVCDARMNDTSANTNAEDARKMGGKEQNRTKQKEVQ